VDLLLSLLKQKILPPILKQYLPCQNLLFPRLWCEAGLLPICCESYYTTKTNTEASQFSSSRKKQGTMTMTEVSNQFCSPQVHVGFFPLASQGTKEVRERLSMASIDKMIEAIEYCCNEMDGDIKIEFTLVGSYLDGKDLKEFIDGQDHIELVSSEPAQLLLRVNKSSLLVVALVGGGSISGFDMGEEVVEKEEPKPVPKSVPKSAPKTAPKTTAKAKSVPKSAPKTAPKTATKTETAKTAAEKKKEPRAIFESKDDYAIFDDDGFECSQFEVQGIRKADANVSFTSDDSFDMTQRETSHIPKRK
jgi:hypothetical protein